MLHGKRNWIIGILVTALIFAIPILLFVGIPKATGQQVDNPRANLPQHPVPTDHSGFFENADFKTGQDVTKACLECHPEAGEDMLHNNHFTWTHEYTQDEVPGIHDNIIGLGDTVKTGKGHVLNNFCITVKPNWPACTSCHTGYSWEDDNYDFSNPENVDCLACHDNTGYYVKSQAGVPAEAVDLVDIAKHVGNPTRLNCGTCHFRGGGGDAVKHGDLDNSLINPPDDLDVHMGKNDMVCTDCHRYEGDHVFKGRSISVSLDDENQAHCTDCHSDKPHEDDRINLHTSTVACQTCHIPAYARKEATKTFWDWSQAGQDLPINNPHVYLKIKGKFVYKRNVIPDYAWYNGGIKDRYLIGDRFDPTKELELNPPAGDINDPNAKIFPFKIHHATQPYDKQYNILLTPHTYGPGGYWSDFDWDKALKAGAEAFGLPYSGDYGFARTAMYWPITHMVAPADQAVQCNECHTPDGSPGRLDWEALGYPGDPMIYGSRNMLPETANANQGGGQ
jgi:octaheme c-type cytochrome (tetrathionate reductase family)